MLNLPVVPFPIASNTENYTMAQRRTKSGPQSRIRRSNPEQWNPLLTKANELGHRVGYISLNELVSELGIGRPNAKRLAQDLRDQNRLGVKIGVEKWKY